MPASRLTEVLQAEPLGTRVLRTEHDLKGVSAGISCNWIWCVEALRHPRLLAAVAGTFPPREVQGTVCCWQWWMHGADI